jgi:large subunit ribosomal protein L1
MISKDKFVKAIAELRKQESEKHKKVGFDQTVDLIVNLRDYDVKRTPMNLLIELPNKVKDKKVAAFFEKKSDVIDTITKEEFGSYSDKVKLKKLIKEYDFFIANAKLMPAVATTFGRTLGPSGKMPSPQMGILPNETPEAIKALVKRIGTVVKVRAKEPSVKIAIGKASLTEEQIAENASIVYNKIFAVLPKKNDNLKSVLIKFTMGKPVKVEMK